METEPKDITGQNLHATANIREVEKLANIAEILELLEETHKDNDWIIHQIRQKRLKVPVKVGMKTIAILKACPSDFISYILTVLRSREEDFETPPPLTRTYHWFFTDIVASTEPTITTNEQASKIIVFNKLIERTEIFKQKNPNSTLILPTGDGVAIGFDDSPEKPLLLALQLHENLYKYNQQKSEKDRISARIGLDTGPVYLIKDLSGKENVWGPGIITARRIMDLARGMNILASATIANAVGKLRPEYKRYLHPIGDYSIKHGEKVLIYNVYGNGLGNTRNPPKDKVQKSKAGEENLNIKNRFFFSKIDLVLYIKDQETMLTHHTLVWNFVNISEEPIDRIFYHLDGDVPRDFPQLNVVVKDGEDEELEIMSLNVNKPYHKEFFIKLRKPVRPHKNGIAKLEYDWEEIDRKFHYRFAADCKRFKYILNVPTTLHVKRQVVEIDDTGNNVLSTQPSTATPIGERTEITWSASDLHAKDAYRFDW